MRTLYGLAALALVANPAMARPVQMDGDSQRTAVSYADLDLTTAAGHAALAARIRRAAEAVCGPSPDQKDVKAVMAFEGCMKQSVDTAVAAIPTASQMAGNRRPAG
jgi:UrcA family protein